MELAEGLRQEGTEARGNRGKGNRGKVEPEGIGPPPEPIVG
jgi:hypothetical protein